MIQILEASITMNGRADKPARILPRGRDSGYSGSGTSGVLVPSPGQVELLPEAKPSAPTPTQRSPISSPFKAPGSKLLGGDLARE